MNIPSVKEAVSAIEEAEKILPELYEVQAEAKNSVGQERISYDDLHKIVTVLVGSIVCGKVLVNEVRRLKEEITGLHQDAAGASL